MKTKVYSFRAEPGFVPDGMKVKDYLETVKNDMQTKGLIIGIGIGLVITIISTVLTANKIKKSITYSLNGKTNE